MKFDPEKAINDLAHMMLPPRPPMRPLFPIKTAAAYLGFSEKTLYRLVRKGAIPHTRVGRAIRFDINTLQEWIRRNSKGGE